MPNHDKPTFDPEAAKRALDNSEPERPEDAIKRLLGMGFVEEVAYNPQTLEGGAAYNRALQEARGSGYEYRTVSDDTRIVLLVNRDMKAENDAELE